MEKFAKVSSVAAILPESNIDTDVIYPARYLLLTVREGLGNYAFHDHRFRADGSENPDFPLNAPPVKGAKILIAGENFGCGSSREQAVWALKDYGVRVVIATRFGEIFYNNCFKNAVLPIVLDATSVETVSRMAATHAKVTVDLEARTIACPGWPDLPFAIDEFRREAMLNGWDEITLILQRDADDIASFEHRQKVLMPWLYDAAWRSQPNLKDNSRDEKNGR